MRKLSRTPQRYDEYRGLTRDRLLELLNELHHETRAPLYRDRKERIAAIEKELLLCRENVK